MCEMMSRYQLMVLHDEHFFTQLILNNKSVIFENINHSTSVTNAIAFGAQWHTLADFICLIQPVPQTSVEMQLSEV